MLQEKKENNFNKWFVGVFHSTNNSGTLETAAISAEISWEKNLEKVKIVEFPIFEPFNQYFRGENDMKGKFPVANTVFEN